MGGMGGGPRRSAREMANAPQRGEDVAATLSVSFIDSVHGCEREISFAALDTCGACDGTGAAEGAKTTVCTDCGGQGVQTLQQGMFAFQRTCGTCGGTGEVVDKPCGRCGGEKRVPRRRTMKVTVPAGIASGNQMRIKGKGDAGLNGGPAGNLMLLVRVAADPTGTFHREGDDVHSEARVGVATAALGGQVGGRARRGKAIHSSRALRAGERSGGGRCRCRVAE